MTVSQQVQIYPKIFQNVGILGPEIDHQRSLVAMLGSSAGNQTLIPDSNSYFQGRATGLTTRIERVVDQLWGTRNQDYLHYLCKLLDDAHTEAVVAYWGTNPLADLLALRLLRPHIKLVLMVLCYPLSLNYPGVARQQWMMRRAAKVLDGFIFPSIEMARFFEQTVFGKARPAYMILPPFWPKSFQAVERADSASNSPNLVFIGRTDLSHRTVHAGDDIRPLMRGLLDAGIELHHVRSDETNDGHPMRHPFEPVGQSHLIEMMGRYDASLIAYNTNVCARDDRFRLTVPDRLITSVAAGVPIAIPAQGYEASKNYLREYPAVFTFKSPQDLKQQLSDRAHVTALREAAWTARVRYHAEGQETRLRAFLAEV